jgi:hypothetical protein
MRNVDIWDYYMRNPRRLRQQFLEEMRRRLTEAEQLRREIQEIRRMQREMDGQRAPPPMRPPTRGTSALRPTEGPSFAEYAKEYVRTQWPKEQARTGRFREAGLAQPSHPYHPYADEAWQYPGWEERLRTIGREAAREKAEEGRYREVGLAPPHQPLEKMEALEDIFSKLPVNPLAYAMRERPASVLDLYSPGYHKLPEHIRMAWRGEAEEARRRGEETRRQAEREAPITEAIERAKGLTLTVRQFPYLLGERPGTWSPVREDERARMLREYPWSDYGKAVIGRTVMGRMTPIEGRLLEAGGYATALPGGIGVVRLGGAGETVPHEIAHVAQFVFPFWEEIKDEFPQALREWLVSEPMEEWDEQKRYVFNAWVRRGKPSTTWERIAMQLPGAPEVGDVEVYATLAQTPWLIPPELEQFFPQYDLRSRGPTARGGYRGPTYPSFWPPPRPTGPKIR